MCTLTWLFNDDSSGYTVLFNRDELKTRKCALPPSLKQTHSGVTFLSPTDTDAGGTWLAVNQYGLTFCLLNYYAADANVPHVHSRGEVINSLVGSRSVVEFEAELRSLNLQHYKGFEIVVIHNSVHHWRWDRQALREVQASMPITSSSYNTELEQRARYDYFQKTVDATSLDSLKAFHQCHLDEKMNHVSAPLASEAIINSVCIHREFSQTVSQCMVRVNDGEVAIDYLDGPPCEDKKVIHSSLIRRQVA